MRTPHHLTRCLLFSVCKTGRWSFWSCFEDEDMKICTLHLARTATLHKKLQCSLCTAVCDANGEWTTALLRNVSFATRRRPCVRPSVCHIVAKFQKKRPRMMRFSPNGCPKTLVFSDVNMLGAIRRVSPPAKQFSTGSLVLEFFCCCRSSKLLLERWRHHASLSQPDTAGRTQGRQPPESAHASACPLANQTQDKGNY